MLLIGRVCLLRFVSVLVLSRNVGQKCRNVLYEDILLIFESSKSLFFFGRRTDGCFWVFLLQILKLALQNQYLVLGILPFWFVVNLSSNINNALSWHTFDRPPCCIEKGKWRDYDNISIKIILIVSVFYVLIAEH